MSPAEEQRSVAQEKIEKLLQSAEDSRKNKRIEHGLRGLLSGNFPVLKNDELVRAMPGHILGCVKEKKHDSLQALLISLGQASLITDVRIRERAVMVLAFAAGPLLEDEAADGSILLFSKVLAEWLRAETEFIEGYEVACQLLQRLVILFVRDSNWHDADHILKAFYDIVTGTCQKKASIRSIVSRTQRNIAQQDVLEHLYLLYIKDSSESVGKLPDLLVHIGKLSIIHALSILRESEECTGRDRLIQLLVHGGGLSAQIIHEYMQNDEPWFLICDMIQVLCQMKDDALYPLIEGALRFRDQRIQHEVLMCIFRAGGPGKTLRLVHALQHVVDPLKIVLIIELGKKPQAAVGDALRSLLNELLNQDAKANPELLSAIVTGLQKFPEESSLKYLGRLTAEIQNDKLDRTLLIPVAETRLMLEAELRHKAHKRIDDEGGVSFTDDPVVQQNSMNKVCQVEQLVAEFAADRSIEQATDLLFSKSVEYAREKDFETAERLRDRLFEANPGAIDKILEVDNIIAFERQSRVPISYLELWRKLQNTLGVQLFEQFYNSVEAETYRAGDIITKEGERDDRLYFINTGEISLHCKTGSSDTFLKRLRAGSVVGREQFFTASVSTITMKAVSFVELHVLRREVLAGLEVDCQEVENKIHDYCLGAIYVPDLLKISGVDRRNSVRYKLSVKIKIQLFDAYGRPGLRPFVSLLQDVSQGGLCFSIGISSKENARLLLGRKVQADVEIAGGNHVKLEGSIVGVVPDYCVTGSYRINVKMFETVPQAEIKYLLNTFTG